MAGKQLNTSLGNTCPSPNLLELLENTFPQKQKWGRESAGRAKVKGPECVTGRHRTQSSILGLPNTSRYSPGAPQHHKRIPTLSHQQKAYCQHVQRQNAGTRTCTHIHAHLCTCETETSCCNPKGFGSMGLENKHQHRK